MKNCKVTQYKKGVDNNNLETYGELVYEIPSDYAGLSKPFTLGAIDGGTISIEGNLELWDYNETTNLGSSYTNPFPAPNSLLVNVKIKGAGTVRVTNKYNCKYSTYVYQLYPTKFGYDMHSISYWWKGSRFNADRLDSKGASKICPITGEFKELEKLNLPLTGINVGFTLITGTLRDISFYKNTLQSLDAFGSKITGNIEDLGECVNLTVINKNNNLASGNIVGTVEGFVARQRTAGRTTATMTLEVRGTSITFNGNTITGFSENNLSWDATTITLNGVTITA